MKHFVRYAVEFLLVVAAFTALLWLLLLLTVAGNG